MTTHLDVNDPRFADAAEAILRRHDNFEAEANITLAVPLARIRDQLTELYTHCAYHLTQP